MMMGMKRRKVMMMAGWCLMAICQMVRVVRMMMRSVFIHF